jgi:malic enzyme
LFEQEVCCTVNNVRLQSLRVHCLQFVNAVMARWPNAVLQFEDFQMAHALTLLQRYRHHHLVFNDDIQVRGWQKVFDTLFVCKATVVAAGCSTGG